MCTCVRSIFKVTIILSPYYIICRCKYSVFHQNFQKNHTSVSCIKKNHYLCRRTNNPEFRTKQKNTKTPIPKITVRHGIQVGDSF